MNLRTLFQSAALVAGLFLVFTWTARGAVSLGIDELEKSNFSVLQGKRVGLVTNPSGVDSKGRSAIDVLFHGSGFHLVKLFGPEHGIDGQTKAGDPVSNSRDRRTGLPVYALLSRRRETTASHDAEMFSGLDVVVYDVQDLGNRSYTFISTLGYVMDQCAIDNIQVIVLDRPNPLGGLRIEGPRLDPSFKPSFVGLYDIPLVYGLTPGELAEWINAKYLAKPCRLTIVAMKGWIRPMVWEDTGLRWVPTSPNIPTIGAARAYTATGFLGEIGIESGCGGPNPFQVVQGRDWDAQRRRPAIQRPPCSGRPRQDPELRPGERHLPADRSAQLGQSHGHQLSGHRNFGRGDRPLFDLRPYRRRPARHVRQNLRYHRHPPAACRGTPRQRQHPFVGFRSGALGGGTAALSALRIDSRLIQPKRRTSSRPTH